MTGTLSLYTRMIFLQHNLARSSLCLPGIPSAAKIYVSQRPFHFLRSVLNTLGPLMTPHNVDFTTRNVSSRECGMMGDEPSWL